MKPYVIATPPFEVTSGGVRVMYGLYGWLLAKGQIAYLNEKPLVGDFIAIYPEIQEGNPANATTVVRYILNKPGVVPAIYSDGTVKKGPTGFDETDKLYYFSRLFGEIENDYYLFLPIANLHLFKDQHKMRRKTCFMLGKAIQYPDTISKFIHPRGSFEITREFAQDQQALADMLNECHTLYCYDPVSAIMEIARLCGCRIIYIPSIYTKNEMKKYEPGLGGINWGKDEGIGLKTESFKEHYESMISLFSQKLDTFIEETQV
jgi:hypothetical protein